MRRILDLFCGAGGAAMGLHTAWPDAEIVGIDINPQPHYPFTFVRANVIQLSIYPNGRFSIFEEDAGPGTGEELWTYKPDFIWASPPCQKHSRLNGINQKEYADFIESTRKLLSAGPTPFVIENVVGAPLIDPVTLCGSMFGLGVWRHRIFELHGFRFTPPACRHSEYPEPLDVTGTGGPCAQRSTGGGGLHRKPKNMAQASRAMGIDWMTRKELVQSIPPAYADHILRQLP